MREIQEEPRERDAEDLARTAMLRVSSAWPGFRNDSSLSTWIHRVAIRTEMSAWIRAFIDHLPDRAREKLRNDLQERCSFYRDESTGRACDRKPSA